MAGTKNNFQSFKNSETLDHASIATSNILTKYQVLYHNQKLGQVYDVFHKNHFMSRGVHEVFWWPVWRKSYRHRLTIFFYSNFVYYDKNECCPPLRGPNSKIL